MRALDIDDVLAEAEQLGRRILQLQHRAFDTDHPDIAHTLATLGYLLRMRGDLDQAEALYREALAMQCRMFGNGHPEVARTLEHLEFVLRSKGDHESADRLACEAETTESEQAGDQHVEVGGGPRGVVVLESGDTISIFFAPLTVSSGVRPCLESRELWLPVFRTM